MKPSPKNNPPPELERLRGAIDSLDRELLTLLNQRLGYAKQIGQLKARQGAPVLDAGREAVVLRQILDQNPGPISDSALRHIFGEIMSVSREIQSPQLVTYLGPEATFTHMAAMNHFGHFAKFTPQPSIREVFGEVERQAFHYGVVPVENSIEGSVNSTLDLFYDSEIKICAEIYFPICHGLLSTEAAAEAIRVVYSHPHAFAQCGRWLRKHLPDARLVECGSTALAARRAAAESGAAAIASREAAGIYNLSVLAARIEDSPRNTTRFLVIGRDAPPVTGCDKTTLMFVTSHVPGALYRTLKPMADAGINMVKLESRPARHENWSYMFFADLEGHMQDPQVRQTVAEMEALSRFLKWLGSYPRAGGEIQEQGP